MADPFMTDHNDQASTFGLSAFKTEDLSAELAQVTHALYDGDRRLDPRLPMPGFHAKVRLAKQGENTPWTKCEPLDFSRSGMLIRSTTTFNEGDAIWLEVDTNGAYTGIPPFQVGAVVRHTRKQNDHLLIGAEFRLGWTANIRRIQVENSISRLEGFLHALNMNQCLEKAGDSQ